MKQYTFKDGTKVIASTKEEAIEQHKKNIQHQVTAARSIKTGDVKELDSLLKAIDFEDEADILDGEYSDKEIKFIKKVFGTIEAKKAMNDIKKEYAKYKKETKKYFDAIEKAKKPFLDKVGVLKGLIDKVLSKIGNTYIRETIWALWEKAVKKAGVPKADVTNTGDEEDDVEYDLITTTFKTKSGKKVQIEFTADTGWYDDWDRSYNNEENPQLENMEVTYDGKKLKCDRDFKNMNKSDIMSTAPKYIKDLYEDTLKYFSNGSSHKVKVVK